MKKFLIQLTALIIVAFAGMYFTYTQLTHPENQISMVPNFSSLTEKPKEERISIVDGQSGELKVGVNITLADNEKEREKGLGGVESMASDSGMLFVFPQQGVYRFWMKGMKFPLDFVWIRGNEIVDLLEKVPSPAPNQQDSTLPIYQPTASIDKVLEVNSGFIARNNIKVGDKILK